MKKAQKEWIKRGGEIARARYREFLKRPEFLTAGLDEEKTAAAIRALNDYLTIEVGMLGDSNWEDKASIAREYERTVRINALNKLECMLRYGTTGNLALYATDN